MFTLGAHSLRTELPHGEKSEASGEIPQWNTELSKESQHEVASHTSKPSQEAIFPTPSQASAENVVWNRDVASEANSAKTAGSGASKLLVSS